MRQPVHGRVRFPYTSSVPTIEGTARITHSTMIVAVDPRLSTIRADSGVWYRHLVDAVIERRIDFALPRGQAAIPAARRLRTELLAAIS